MGGRIRGSSSNTPARWGQPGDLDALSIGQGAAGDPMEWKPADRRVLQTIESAGSPFAMKRQNKTTRSQGKGTLIRGKRESLTAEIRFVKQPPTLDAAAYHGLAGKIALAVGKNTEADSRGVLAGLLIAFGNVIGRTARFRVSNDEHYPVEFGVIVRGPQESPGRGLPPTPSRPS